MFDLPNEALLRQLVPRPPADTVVAIDGPAGSGKSTTAKALAKRFDLLYIDSGAMYRALTLAALRSDTPSDDGSGLAALLRDARLELRPAEAGTTVLWNGRNVSREIRTPEVDRAVSLVSSHAAVRQQMVERQRGLGRSGGVVMEGRDIGSVVFPLASTKIYLDASLSTRVERRFRQYRRQEQEVERSVIEAELAKRDRLDSERAVSPLTVSPDALVLDTSSWSLAEQVERSADACRVNPYLDTLLDTDLASARRECPWKYRLAYNLMQTLAKFFGLRQIGYEGRAVPRGTILACNHVHWYDPPMIGSTFHRYPIRTIAKRELFAGLGRPFFRWLDVIPIRRKGYDREAFAEARQSLQSGSNVFIFPEGTRRAVGRPGPVKNGLGILAQETEAPIQPLFVRGTWGLQPGGSTRSPLEIRFGPVIRLHALPYLRAHLDRRELSRRVARLCEAVFCELQSRSYADQPETAFERQLTESLTRRFAARHRRLFGSQETAGTDG
jgi:cytidylate kinase